MIIHVVQPGETIQSIADLYGVSTAMLIQNNGITYPYTLAIGQSLVIIYPQQTYTVQEGDTLLSIANAHNVTILQLIQNNPTIIERGYISPGEIIVISYPKRGTITIHGTAAPYINRNTLINTLPYLTYLSLLNYTVTEEGNITTYYDETEVIQLAKEYGVMPLMLITTLSIQGETNISTLYDLLLNEDYQTNLAVNIINILKEKGYYGINLAFDYISVSNLNYIEDFIAKLTSQVNEEGYEVFITINPNITSSGNEIRFAIVDYTQLNSLANTINFVNFEWATNINPPSPVSSIQNISVFLSYILNYISADKIIAGLATIGFDWALPFLPGISEVHSVTSNNAINLAKSVGAAIQFDEVSQTPFFRYSRVHNGYTIDHIVWFIDARSINALLDLVYDNSLRGVIIWNIISYNAQLWSIINSQYDIDKITQDEYRPTP